MIKLLLIRILSFIVLALLVLSLSWVDRLTLLHRVAIPIYLAFLMPIWIFLDWLTGVNRPRNP